MARPSPIVFPHAHSDEGQNGKSVDLEGESSSSSGNYVKQTWRSHHGVSLSAFVTKIPLYESILCSNAVPGKSVVH